MSEEDIRTYTIAELRAMRARGESRTDWARVDRITEEELEAAIAADPDSDAPLFDPNDAVLVVPGELPQVVLRVDPDVLDWFRAGGPDYRARMNEALRRTMIAEKQGAG